ncbi:MAG: cytochrome c family protein [Planctomycetes bacterium]|nr:cytochrome c family protein [Planctomycetota bacterium]
MRYVWAIVGAVAVAGVVGAVVGSGSASAAGDTPTYVGADKCKACHLKEFKSWKETGLAKAFEALKPNVAADKKTAAKLDPAKDYSGDPACLKCHSTGYGTASGYPAVEAGKPVAETDQARATANQGVTCEACHGPGSLYPAFKKNKKDFKFEEIAALGAVKPSAESCAPCHAKECPTMPADYKFDFEASKHSPKMHEHFPLKNPH